jgi:hypothetical protein
MEHNSEHFYHTVNKDQEQSSEEEEKKYAWSPVA